MKGMGGGEGRFWIWLGGISRGRVDRCLEKGPFHLPGPKIYH